MRPVVLERLACFGVIEGVDECWVGVEEDGFWVEEERLYECAGRAKVTEGKRMTRRNVRK